MPEKPDQEIEEQHRQLSELLSPEPKDAGEAPSEPATDEANGERPFTEPPTAADLDIEEPPEPDLILEAEEEAVVEVEAAVVEEAVEEPAEEAVEDEGSQGA